MTGEVKRVLREEMDARGWLNNDWRAGLAAIVGGESEFTPKRETGYSHTSNERIRRFFSRARGLSDEELNAIKATDRTWFNFVYGERFGNRPGTNDGYNFRGGGLNQLTFRANYAKFGPLVGVDLTAHPEMIVVPRIAASVAVEYMKANFDGGDFGDMKAAVGVSMGEPDDRKNELYALYSRTGEWDYRKVSVPVVEDAGDPVGYDPVVTNFLNSLTAFEKFAKRRKLYTGRVGDNDPGPGVRAALKAYLRTARK